MPLEFFCLTDLNSYDAFRPDRGVANRGYAKELVVFPAEMLTTWIQ